MRDNDKENQTDDTNVKNVAYVKVLKIYFNWNMFQPIWWLYIAYNIVNMTFLQF